VRFNVCESTESLDRASRGIDWWCPESLEALVMERFRMAESKEEASSLKDVPSGPAGVLFMLFILMSQQQSSKIVFLSSSFDAV
jgi:hypothetical protein